MCDIAGCSSIIFHFMFRNNYSFKSISSQVPNTHLSPKMCAWSVLCFSRMSLDCGSPVGKQAENQSGWSLKPFCVSSAIHQKQSAFAKCFSLADECFVTKAQFHQKNPVEFYSLYGGRETKQMHFRLLITEHDWLTFHLVSILFLLIAIINTKMGATKPADCMATFYIGSCWTCMFKIGTEHLCT